MLQLLARHIVEAGVHGKEHPMQNMQVQSHVEAEEVWVETQCGETSRAGCWMW